MGMSKVKTPLILLVAVFTMSVLVFEAYALWFWRVSGAASLPGDFGNFERTRARRCSCPPMSFCYSTRWLQCDF